MTSPPLTVILPCHDVAQFVSPCLRSIFQQPQAEKLRVLVIDDGSVDGTSQVVLAEMAAHADVECELVTQANQGVSCARNTGLRLVKTPYVTFIDGDDLWTANHVESIMPFMEEGRADIIAFSASVVDMAGRRVRGLRSHTLFTREGRFSASELARDAAAVGEWHSCTRVFKTWLFDGVFFPPGRYFEDSAVLPGLYARALHIETLKDELYFYRRRPNSITSSITDKHIDDLLLNARECAMRASEDAERTEYWQVVRRKLIGQIAAEIGRAPTALRRSMLSRAWPGVRDCPDLGFKVNWLFRLLDASLRSEVKRLLGRESSLADERARPPASSAS